MRIMKIATKLQILRYIIYIFLGLYFPILILFGRILPIDVIVIPPVAGILAVILLIEVRSSGR